MAIKMNRREKTAVSAGLAFLAVFALLQWIVFPFFEKQERMKRVRAAKEETLREMLLLKSEYEALQQQTQALQSDFAKRDKGFRLFSFLDQLAGKTGIKENISYMKPSTANPKNSPFKIVMIEMKLQAVTLEQLTQYLYSVETSRNMITVSAMSVSKTSKPEGYINAILKFETYEA